MTPILTTKNLAVGYEGRPLLSQINLQIQPQEIYILLGGSGCGKSTLLNHLIGLLPILDGEVNLLGQQFDKNSNFPNHIRQKMGVLFQNGALLSSLTVEENVGLALHTHYSHLPHSWIRHQVMEKLKAVHLETAWNKYPSELSGGMRKRVALARALIQEPKLLFCDEPSAGLDPVTAKSLDQLFLRLRDELGLTLILVTHELDSIHTLCDRFSFLAQGTCIFSGSLHEINSHAPQEVRDFFERKPRQQWIKEK